MFIFLFWRKIPTCTALKLCFLCARHVSLCLLHVYFFAQCCVTHFLIYCSLLYIILRVGSLPWYMKFILLVVHGCYSSVIQEEILSKNIKIHFLIQYCNPVAIYLCSWAVSLNMQCMIVSWTKMWLLFLNKWPEEHVFIR